MSTAIHTLLRIMTAGLLLLATSQAHAVGLGKMRVLSALDQPLNAEIELISTTPAELNTLQIGLGSRSDFRRANVERSSILSLISFEPAVRENGSPYIKVSSKEPVSEPFLHFLIALEWAGGKLIREYTALLDPPLYAQGRPASVSSPRVAGTRPAGTGTLVQPATPPVSTSRRPVSAPVEPGAGRYGPIRRGETVSGIVGRMQLDPGTDVFQAMFALLQKNPRAFIRGNLNLLKEGSTLQMPTAQEISAISKIVASTEYTKHLDEWLAYRNQVASGQPSGRAVSTPVQGDDGLRPTPLDGTETVLSDTELSEDVLRILQEDSGGQISGGQQAGAESEELSTLRSQLVVMEESLLSTELENKELRKRLAVLEQQIKETNKLLKVNNAGLALAESNNAQSGGQSAQPQSDAGAQESESQMSPASDRTTRSTRTSSFMPMIEDLIKGDMLWKLLLALAAIVLLIGIVVYVRRRQSYAEFEETMMTGSTYDLRSGSSAFTQMPRMDTMQHSQPSMRADSHSQQTASGLMQTSFMTEMGAPGMGAMHTDEVDPIAEAEVYMAYGRDQQAMEVLQDAIRRDPGRSELKIKLLEVYQKRKDVRAFEALAEELYGSIGKDQGKWGRVTEMGRRVSPKHPLFAAAAGGASLTAEASSTIRGPGSIDRDSSGLDLISAPFSRSNQSAPTPETIPQAAPEAMDVGALDFALDADSVGAGSLDAYSVSMPMSSDLNVASMPASEISALGGETIDDFKASEIATKLDLAKAYMEMGDKDAARGFLDEVLKEGNEAQRQQASEIASSF